MKSPLPLFTFLVWSWCLSALEAGAQFGDAIRIGRQILRENALELFPQLKARLWKR